MNSNLIPLLHHCSAKVIKSTNWNLKHVQFVGKAYFEQIRNIPHATDHERINRIKVVQAKIVLIAQAYGARERLHPTILDSCTALVFERFAHFSIDDIEQAYQMKASGQIKVIGGEMYGGQFNADNFGKVLTSYNNWRKLVLAKFIEEKVKFEAKERQSSKALVGQILFEITFPYILEQAKERIEDWRQVPLYWYEAAFKRGMIVFKKGEAQSIYKDAEAFVSIEVKVIQEEDLSYKIKKNIILTEKKVDLVGQILFEITFPYILEQAKERIDDWRQVPLYWYEAAFKRGMIVFKKGEAQSIFKDAEALVGAEVKAIQEEDLSYKIKKNIILTEKKVDLVVLQKTIARRLSVFRKIILNPDWKAADYYNVNRIL